MPVSALRRLGSGLVVLALAALIFSYSRLIRTVELAATSAGYVDSEVAGR